MEKVVPIDQSECYQLNFQKILILNAKGNPLDTHPKWKNTVEIDGKKLTRETDTLDTFVCSSWYFLRFCSPKHEYGFNEKKLIIGCQ